MRFSDARGRKVVSTDTATTVGTISEFVVDPERSTVIALSLGKTSGTATALPWSSIQAFGADAVTVSSPAVIVEPDAEVTRLTGKTAAILRKRVLATTGVELGSVSDVEFDPTSGQITSLLLPELVVPGDRLLGVGSYAVVVRG